VWEVAKTMSDDHGAGAATAIGPAQARALRRASLPDDDQVPGTRATEPIGDDRSSPDAANSTDSARDTATAADQAARMSVLNSRSDGLLERLRDTEVEAPVEPAADEVPTKRRWRRS
jgi:hypothetical protein